MLSGAVEVDDTCFGGPTTGSKRDYRTEKAKVFLASSLDEYGDPKYLKMSVTEKYQAGFGEKVCILVRPPHVRR